MFNAEIAEEERVSSGVVGFEGGEGVTRLSFAQMTLVAHQRLEPTSEGRIMMDGGSRGRGMM